LKSTPGLSSFQVCYTSLLDGARDGVDPTDGVHQTAVAVFVPRVSERGAAAFTDPEPLAVFPER
jgi:hypothetical protein